MGIDRNEQRRIVEALVLASPEPITPVLLAGAIPYATPKKVAELVDELNEHYRADDRAFEIWEVGGGYQVRTLAEFSGYLQKLRKERPMRLSRAALETLSVVAYKQPVTRNEIEDVRGVDVGAVLKSLMERHLVRIAGHKDVPGRPLLYGTTKRFLEVFGLDSLKSLPTLRELEELVRERAEAEAESAAEDGQGALDLAAPAIAVRDEDPDEDEVDGPDEDASLDAPGLAAAGEPVEAESADAAGGDVRDPEHDAGVEDEPERD